MVVRPDFTAAYLFTLFPPKFDSTVPLDTLVSSPMSLGRHSLVTPPEIARITGIRTRDHLDTKLSSGPL